MFSISVRSLIVLAVPLHMAAAQSPSERRAQFLQVIDRPRVALAASQPRVTSDSGYTQEYVTFATARDERVPAITIRKGTRSDRQPVVILLHGTGGSKENMRADMRALADRGFLAVAIDAPHHGERAIPIPGLANPYQSAMLRTYRTGVGHPYLYDTVWDVMRLIDYLVTRTDVDSNRIGLLGLSKGGTEAYLAAAVDTRITAVVPWIGVQSFGWSLKHASAWEARVWTFHQAVEAAAADSLSSVNANFVRKFYNRVAPGLTDAFDGPAMLPLIAPRPLLVINGDSDPRSALGGVRECVAAAQRAYAGESAADRFAFLLETNAAHEVTAEAKKATIEWFVRWLKP